MRSAHRRAYSFTSGYGHVHVHVNGIVCCTVSILLSQFKFKNWVRRWIHCLTHTSMNRCNWCDYRAAKQATLKRHQESNPRGVKYRCDYNGTLQGNLKIHKQCKHDQSVMQQQRGFKTDIRNPSTKMGKRIVISVTMYIA